MGGLSKKAAFISAVQVKSDVPTLLLDAGNQLFKQQALPPAAGEAKAAKIKAQGVVAANQKMGLRHAAVGMHDLAAGPDFLRGLAEGNFTWLSLNLRDRHSDQALFPGYTIIQIGKLPVAILALTNHRGNLGGSNASYHILPWQEVLPAALAQLRPQAGMLILLSNYPLAENREIARLYPQVDLIFQSGQNIGNLAPIAGSRTLISQTAIRGRYLGLLEVDWQGPGPWRQPGKGALPKKDQPGSSFSQRFIPLTAAMADDPATEELIRQVEKQAQATLR
ncbi:MAG: hypothetical protein HQQ73_06175 [Desulfobulbaceae bacterium]|nr:hypothetical protein [Desulfobulbaceae bacterium]